MSNDEEGQGLQAKEPAPYKVTIKNWPEGDRPREKLMKHGSEVLSDAELLAIMINTGTGEQSAVDVARAILGNFSDLRDLSRRTVKELVKQKGIGTAKAVTILAAFELGRRSAAVPDNEDGIGGPEDVARIYIPKMRDLAHERFIALMLNNAGKVLREEIISEGTVNSTVIHPREVFRTAVVELASSVILLHNHPSGTKTASRADHDITKQMVEAGKLMDIPVQDHIIICGNSYVSFVESGWM
jgi:DNA repair protein RadC